MKELTLTERIEKVFQSATLANNYKSYLKSCPESFKEDFANIIEEIVNRASSLNDWREEIQISLKKEQLFNDFLEREVKNSLYNENK